MLGVAEPDIGRLDAYLNCRYGLSAPVKGKRAPVPPVEVRISLYRSPAQAARRVQATIDYYRAHNASDRPVRVASGRACPLTGYGPADAGGGCRAQNDRGHRLAEAAGGGATAELAALAKAALDAYGALTRWGSAAAGGSPSNCG